MESYLMMLYVTLEQESALKNFFVKQGWEFSKPDLTVTTNRLGPSVPDAQTVKKSLSSGTSPTVVGKRKAKMKLKAPVVKMAKVISSKSHISSKSELNNEPSISDVQLDTENKDTKSRSRVDKKRECKSSVNLNKLTVKEENLDQSEIAEISNDDGDGDTDLDCNFEESAEGSDIKTDEFKMENSLTNESENDTEDAEVEAGVNNTKASVKEKGEASKEEKSTKNCVTCQHFEEQAIILEKGPGIPDKDADEPNVFICDVCGKQFIHKNTYKRHLQSHEMPVRAKTVRERKWNCSNCDKVFGSEANLKEHVSQVHLKKPGEFMCHLCPKSYTRAGRLQAHLNTHFGIRPYSCKSCLTAFSGKASLIEHQKKCEGGVTVRFKCQLCLQYFSFSEDLKLHRSQQHADVYVLSPCGKKIRWKSSLKKHTTTCVKCKDIETVKHMTGNM